MTNQTPEQIARDYINSHLISCCWVIQDNGSKNLSEGQLVTVREYTTDIGPADYVLFINRSLVGVIEAKRVEIDDRICASESQFEEYSLAKLKLINNEPLSFLYLSK